MALVLVYGGGATNGGVNGTVVSSGNPIVIGALNTPVTAYIRCDAGYWSNDQDFDVPAELEVSFDDGATWYGNGDEPITAPEIYAVNVPIKVQQVTAAGSTAGSFVTDGTYTAIAALSTPTLTATVVSPTQIDLSWTNVSNEDASPGYTLQRATDSGFTANLTTVGTYAQNVTTASDTGLTASTHYYYRVKAEGSGRYSDSAYGTDDDTTSAAPPFREDTFADTDGTALTSHSPTGGSGAWTEMYDNGVGANAEIRVKANRALVTYGSGTAATTIEAWLSGTSNADCAAEMDVYVYSVVSGALALVGCRVTGTFGARNQYRAYLTDDGTLTLTKVVSGTNTSLGTYSVGTLTPGTTYTIRVEAIGTAIKAYVNGVQRISATDSAVTTGGGLALQVSCPTATAYTSSGTGFGIDAVRLYNT